MSEITPALTLTSGIFPGPYDRYILNSSSLAAAVDGTLWAGTDDGLCMYSSSHGDFTVMSRTPLYLPGNRGNFVAPGVHGATIGEVVGRTGSPAASVR